MMLTQTIDKLHRLKLSAMARALEEQTHQTVYGELAFEERLGLLVDRELAERDNRKLATLLKGAKLRFPNACPEDIDFRTPRGLSREAILSLCQNGWVTNRQNVIITGPTGVGKSYLACALGQKACRMGYRVFYQRLTRLLAELEIARGDGRYPRLINNLSKIDVLILDDWGLEGGITDRQRRDLLEILDDRYASRSTIVTSQLPVDRWHDHIGDPTLADAILDRLIHNAHRIPLDGPSMRRKKGGHQPENTTTD